MVSTSHLTHFLEEFSHFCFVKHRWVIDAGFAGFISIWGQAQWVFVIPSALSLITFQLSNCDIVIECDRFWHRATYDFHAAFNSMTPQILNVLRVIRNNAPYSDLLYVKILPRSYWHQLSCRLARRIDCFITGRLRRTHRIKEIWVHEVMYDRVDRRNEIVLPGMMSTDEVHLNNNGNRALCKAIIRPITSKWLAYKRYDNSHRC